jgi:hypothetical protein
MTVTEMIQAVGNDGLTIKLSDTGGLAYSGERAVTEKWLSVLRERKAEILACLKQSVGTNTAPEHWDIRQAAEKLTNWRPKDAWFLRRHIPDATMEGIHMAYWLAVGYFGTIPGTTPERAKQYTVNDIQLWREVRRPGTQRKLYLP